MGSDTLPRQAAAVVVDSADEFSPLAQVVVGTAAGARIPAPARDRSAWLNLYPEMTGAELSAISDGQFPAWLLEEAEEDLGVLAAALSAAGVTVHRPAPVPHDREFATPHWRARGFGSYCPRDLALIIGRLIIQAPSPMRARMHELAGLRHLFRQASEHGGATWIAAPPPELRADMFPLDGTGHPRLGEGEPAFDAANVLRAGGDLYYLVSGSGNEAGLRWLQAVASAFGGHRVHPVRGLYPYTHIDSTIALIREGLTLLNPARVPGPDVLPGPLRSWQHLWCPPMTTAAPALRYPLSSEWIGMNLLMVNPGTAVVDGDQGDLIALLERHRVEVIPVRLRHARVLGGGVHCATLDLHRIDASAPPRIPPDRTVVTITPKPARGGPLAARYAELRTPAALSRIKARSAVIHALRGELHGSGHVEVDTPLLQRAQPAPGRSFRPETLSLDPHLYLRSSPLHLRAMLTTGLPRVFEIGRTFRDEQADPTHSPEYSLVEVYQAGAGYRDLQATARDLILAAAAASGTTVVTLPDGTHADLAAPWPEVPFYDALSAAAGETITPGTPAGRLRQVALDHGVLILSEVTADDIALTLYDRLAEPAARGPVFHVDFPAGPSPLARPCARDARLAQKWDLVIGGREIATAYTEQHDPGELRRRLDPGTASQPSGEAGTMDGDWLEVFDAGMPPAGGLCIGLERLLLTITSATDLRDVIPFPLAS